MRSEHQQKRYEATRKWAKNNPEKVLFWRKQYREKLKTEVLSAYGGLRCYCCGETRLHFLTLEHLNNDGGAHRKAHASNQMYYHYLRKSNYPQDLKIVVACFNCNCGRKAAGTARCPHMEDECESPTEE